MNAEPGDTETDGHGPTGRPALRIGGVIMRAIVAAVGCVLLGCVAWILGYIALERDRAHLGDLATLGNYLQGTVGSLWSLAGVFIIFVAFLAQMRQLHLQQYQFERQSFEASFFQLLALHNELVAGLRDVDGGAGSGGRGVFWVLHDRLKNAYAERTEGRPVSEADEALAVACYESVYQEHQDVLGYYFRHLYHIVKFVDECPIGFKDKKRHTSILRAQLSAFEHLLLYYNGLSRHGLKGTKPLIEKYALLENMSPQLRLNPEATTGYARAAFGDDAAMYPIQD